MLEKSVPSPSAVPTVNTCGSHSLLNQFLKPTPTPPSVNTLLDKILAELNDLKKNTPGPGSQSALPTTQKQILTTPPNPQNQLFQPRHSTPTPTPNPSLSSKKSNSALTLLKIKKTLPPPTDNIVTSHSNSSYSQASLSSNAFIPKSPLIPPLATSIAPVSPPAAPTISTPPLAPSPSDTSLSSSTNLPKSTFTTPRVSAAFLTKKRLSTPGSPPLITSTPSPAPSSPIPNPDKGPSPVTTQPLPSQATLPASSPPQPAPTLKPPTPPTTLHKSAFATVLGKIAQQPSHQPSSSEQRCSSASTPASSAANSPLPATTHIASPTKKTPSPPPAPPSNFGTYLIALLILTFIIGIGVFGFYELFTLAQKNSVAANPAPLPLPPQTTAPPRILAFQGRLANSTGKPLTDNHQLSFSLYDTDGGQEPPPTGGNLVWASGVCTIPLNSEGLFSANLGAGQGTGQDNQNCGPDLGRIFAENSNLWLEIHVADEVLFPRQMIKAVPFALNSETLQGYAPSATATANTIPVLNADGNLVFNTASTALINTGDLILTSKAGGILFQPGSGETSNSGNLTNQGDLKNKGHLQVNGDTQLEGNLQVNKTVSIGENLLLSENSNLGIGTKTPSQKLTLKNGHFSFDFLNAPDSNSLQVQAGTPNQMALSAVPAPSSSGIPSLIDNSSGNLNLGTYRYLVTYVTFDGSHYRETIGSPPSEEISTDTEHRQIKLDSLPVYPTENIVARKIYRNPATDAATFKLVTTIADNFTTSFVDNIGDNGLGATVPTVNTTGIFKYKITFYNDAGETNGSAATTLTLTSDGFEARLANIPTDPTNTAIGRKIYRTLAGGNTYYLVGQINNNTTAFFTDNLSDGMLINRDRLSNINSTSGGIFAGNKKAIQLDSDGSVVTTGNLIAEKRLEVSHADNQGLKLPTSLGKPVPKSGQKIGDIVYDAANNLLYIYNGSSFLALHNPNEANLTQTSNAGLCPEGQCSVSLDPEYPQLVLTASGSDNIGDLTANFIQEDNGFYYPYYQWQSQESNLQSYDLVLSFTIPGDFIQWQNSGVTLEYATDTNSVADNKVEAYAFTQNIDSDQYVLSGERVSSDNGQWMNLHNGQEPLILSGATLNNLNLKPGEQIFLKIRVFSKNQNKVRLGRLSFNYLNQNSTPNHGSLLKKIAGALTPADPNQDFLLGGDSTASAKIAFLNMNAGTPTAKIAGNIELTGNTGLNYLDVTSGGNLTLRTAVNSGETPIERLVITNDGKIGIGTNQPRETLDVAGNTIISGSLTLGGMTAEQAGDCNLSYEGKIYYNLEDREFRACRPDDASRTSFSWQKL